MWTWNAETPARVPAGARISAGNSGSVARSFPNKALAEVNRSPVSCIPSPESPGEADDDSFDFADLVGPIDSVGHVCPFTQVAVR
jgi:hypothetical protein